jgi:hypothetical protein
MPAASSALVHLHEQSAEAPVPILGNCPLYVGVSPSQAARPGSHHSPGSLGPACGAPSRDVSSLRSIAAISEFAMKFFHTSPVR